jgi:hypothetical protein
VFSAGCLKEGITMHKAKKVTMAHKVAIGAVSVLSVAASWNVIGRQAMAETAQQVLIEPTPPIAVAIPARIATPWPTIAPLVLLPRLTLKALPEPLEASAERTTGLMGETDVAVPNLGDLPSIAALPTLAPLPALPEYVPPPPPPPRPAKVAAAPSGGGGGNTSKGS